MRRLITTILLLACVVPAWAKSDGEPKPVTPKKTVSLFNGRNYSGWDLFMRPDSYADPADKVFTVKDGAMHITGKGYGGCTTKKAYRDYHLKMQFRFVGEGFEDRAGKAADGGLLFHCIGPEGAWNGIWHLSFECNIIQGRCADLIVVGNAGKFPGSLYAKAYADAGQKWSPMVGKVVSLEDRGRVNSIMYDGSWKDSYSQMTVWPEKPYGEWNTLELICDGDTAEYILNGITVLKLFDLKPSAGRIQLQCECHAIEYRDITISPLK